MNYSNNDYTDISGGILFASLYNSSKNKDNMSITDQMAEDGEYGNVVDIVLQAKNIDYNTFRNVFYPTNTKHFQLSLVDTEILNFDNWYVSTDDGTYRFIFFDFIMSAIEHYLGVSRLNFNPALKIHLEKKLSNMRSLRQFNSYGSAYALTWNEISNLLSQLGILYNNNNDNKALLTLVLNFESPYVPGLTVRIFLPFVVNDIYKNWNQNDRLPLRLRNLFN